MIPLNDLRSEGCGFFFFVCVCGKYRDDGTHRFQWNMGAGVRNVVHFSVSHLKLCDCTICRPPGGVALIN